MQRREICGRWGPQAPTTTGPPSLGLGWVPGKEGQGPTRAESDAVSSSALAASWGAVQSPCHVWSLVTFITVVPQPSPMAARFPRLLPTQEQN